MWLLYNYYSFTFTTHRVTQVRGTCQCWGLYHVLVQCATPVGGHVSCSATLTDWATDSNAPVQLVYDWSSRCDECRVVLALALKSDHSSSCLEHCHHDSCNDLKRVGMLNAWCVSFLQDSELGLIRHTRIAIKLWHNSKLKLLESVSTDIYKVPVPYFD